MIYLNDQRSLVVTNDMIRSKRSVHIYTLKEYGSYIEKLNHHFGKNDQVEFWESTFCFQEQDLFNAFESDEEIEEREHSVQ